MMGRRQSISPENAMVKKRRSHRRKPLAQGRHHDCVINMAQARKEIVHALHLHRSSSPSYHDYGKNDENPMFAAVTDSPSRSSCYWLVESMPTPQPIWSTTDPSVVLVDPSAVLVEKEVEEDRERVLLDQYWGDTNQLASYNWWLRFLHALDQKSNTYSTNHVTLKDGGLKCAADPHAVNAIDQTSSTVDEWLLFP